MCSGLRTETGSERKKERAELGSPHVSHREREREKRNWDCVALCFILTTESGAGERRRQRKGRERVLGLSADKEGEDAACKAKLGLELGGLSGSLPSGYSPTTHCSALLCMPAFLAGPGSSPPAPLFYLPISHTRTNPNIVLPFASVDFPSLRRKDRLNQLTLRLICRPFVETSL